MGESGAVRAVIENWVIWRDSGDFDRLLTCWHSDGRMVTTWGDFDAAGFVAGARAGWERGVDVTHLLGGTSIDIAGKRAVAQTRMTILQRGMLDGVIVDVTCIGRFYDFFECRHGRWAITLRQPIYERDRLDPVVPGTVVRLNNDQLEAFPIGYRHLAYLQESSGMTVAHDLPGRRGPTAEELYNRGARWLAG